MKAKDELGHRGEDRAAAYLAESGFRVVARNWRCPVGEIDIVAHDGPVLVVVEVKTRTSDAYGHPFESITPAKLRRLHLLAAAWVAEREPRRPEVRVDVIGIVWPRYGEPSVQHLKAVG
ncbi:MAG: YraN family protein [Herbiconiux sp.]|nr:YraN family protein [Herbiconiux sp.]